MISESAVPTLFQEQVRIRGRNTLVPAVSIEGRTVVCHGGWLRVARVFDEDLIEGDAVSDPRLFANQLQRSRLGADMFTFLQNPLDAKPQYDLHWEKENLAVIRTDDFKDWWERRLPQESRKNVRRAAKRGVVVREVPFDDALVRGIKEIYDETPVRQGRKFWHYGKSVEAVKNENATYIDRSWFLGAFFKDELIGFLKVIMVERRATLIQILAKNAHHDKRPMNALLAHAVQICEARGASHFVYGKYRYGNKEGDSLGEFKRRNGFEQLVYPRYFVPFTVKGRIALQIGAHRGLANMLPKPVTRSLLKVRSYLLEYRTRKKHAETTISD